MAGFKDKRDLNRYPRSGLANSGRSAGMGISYDLAGGSCETRVIFVKVEGLKWLKNQDIQKCL